MKRLAVSLCYFCEGGLEGLKESAGRTGGGAVADGGGTEVV